MTLLAADALSHDEITTLFLALAILLGLARLMGELARQFHQPAVLGEILAGVLLGPTVLASINPDLYGALFPTGGAAPIALEGLITVSATLLLLAAGLEVDLSSLWRQGKAMVFVSIGGLVVPFAMGFILAWFAADWLNAGDVSHRLAFALFVGIALSITALPVIAKILIDLNISKSDLGVLIISAAMLNDMLGWIGFAIVLAMLPGPLGDTVAQMSEAAVAAGEAAVEAATGGPDFGVAMTVLLTLAFVAFMLTGGRWLLHRALPYVQAHWQWPGGVLVYVMVVALFCAALTNWIGIHSIFGAFIAGIAVGDSRHLRERTRDTIQQFILNIFAPLFFASIGLRTNFIAHFNLPLVVVVFAVACVGKILGCYGGAILAGVSQRESWAVGFGMVARGAMEIILAQIALNAGLIGEELFVAIVIMALATSLISGPAMQRALRLKVKRSIKMLVSERQIIAELRGQDARAVIGEMAAKASELTALDAKEIYEAVWQRERIMRTGLSHGLAVPHARFKDLKKPLMIIGRSPQGVDFDAPDGTPARLIFLMLTPEDDPEAQIEFLQLVAETFEDPVTRNAVLESTSITEMLAALNVAGATNETNGESTG